MQGHHVLLEALTIRDGLVGLGVDRLERLEQPVAQNPELQAVEQRVDLLAVPRLPLEVAPLFEAWLAEQFPDRAERVAATWSPRR